MAVVLLKGKITKKVEKIASRDYGSYIKIVIDIKSKRMTVGGKWHADGEKILLENGSLQENIWGGGMNTKTDEVDFTALINIKPNQNNDSMEILDLGIRNIFKEIAKNKLL